MTKCMCPHSFVIIDDHHLQSEVSRTTTGIEMSKKVLNHVIQNIDAVTKVIVHNQSLSLDTVDASVNCQCKPPLRLICSVISPVDSDSLICSLCVSPVDLDSLTCSLCILVRPPYADIRSRSRRG